MRKKIVAGVLILAMLMPTAVYAKPTETYNTPNTTASDTDKTSPCEVTADIHYAYYVSMPAALTLEVTELANVYASRYKVKAKTDTEGLSGKHIMISPEDTVDLVSEQNNTTVSLSISQDKKYFGDTLTDKQEKVGANNWTEINGVVKATIENQGNYKGNFKFEYGLVNTCTMLGEHVPDTAVRENEEEAGCTQPGSYDSVIYCALCGEELARNTETIDALGHNYVNGVCERCGETEPVQLPVEGTALADMSFADIKAVASAGKAADYGIKVGDTINVNSTVQAQVTEIGEDYIEFATTSKVISATSPQTQSTLVTGQSVTSYGPAAMYKYPQVNYSDKGNTATVSYNGSDLQTNVRAWFDAQSDEFKSSVKESNIVYETATLTFNGRNYSQTVANGTVEVAEKVYIPSKADLESGKFASNPAYTSNYFWTSTPYAFFSGNTHAYCSFGGFYYGIRGGVTNNYGYGNDGAVVLFKIG